jgi:hypothetical protein
VATGCGSSTRTRCISTTSRSISPIIKIILAHPSFPWQEEALSIATHKPNVYIDLSGWSPKYFPPILVRYANSLLKKKMLFGSDWPMISTGEMARRLRQGRFQGRSAAADPEGKRDAAAGRILRAFGVAHRIIAIRCGRSPVILQHMAKR